MDEHSHHKIGKEKTHMNVAYKELALRVASFRLSLLHINFVSSLQWILLQVITCLVRSFDTKCINKLSYHRTGVVTSHLAVELFINLNFFC